MNIGSMSERITVLTPASSSVSSYKQPIVYYTSASLWSNITRERGKEPDEKGAKYSYARYAFIVRNYDDSIDETCYIQYRGHSYNVVFSDLVPWTKRRYLKVIGERRPATIFNMYDPDSDQEFLMEDGTGLTLEDGTPLFLEG